MPVGRACRCCNLASSCSYGVVTAGVTAGQTEQMLEREEGHTEIQLRITFNHVGWGTARAGHTRRGHCRPRPAHLLLGVGPGPSFPWSRLGSPLLTAPWRLVLTVLSLEPPRVPPDRPLAPAHAQDYTCDPDFQPRTDPALACLRLGRPPLFPAVAFIVS